MLRATARFLHGKDFAHLGQHPAKSLPVRASAVLPAGMRRSIYAAAGALEGTSPEHLGAIDMEDIAAWTVAHYPRRRYPAVFIGASNGSVVHLAAATGAPGLPQTMLPPGRRWRVCPTGPTQGRRRGAQPPAPVRN